MKNCVHNFYCGLVLCLLIIVPQVTTAQQNYCGTTMSEEDLTWLRAFQATADYESGTTPYARRAVDFYIPVQVHITGNDAGLGYYRLQDLLRVFCDINQQFGETGFYFYIHGDINYINNSTYHEHEFTEGAQMMLFNNVAGRLNMYFVDDPAGNCGYYSPFMDAVAIAKSCAGPGSTTVAHELGHFFSLPHTFSGWESGTPPGSQQERVDGTNCNSVADGFCDTPPDYAAYRWNCPTTGPFTDPNGEVFTPDGTLYMSYSNDACTERFSVQQQAAMRANLISQRGDLLTEPDPVIVPLDSVSLAEPLDGTEDTPFNYTVLKWTAEANASGYVLTIGLNPPMTAVLTDIVVTDTFYILSDLDETRRYYWKVVPIAEGNTCASYSVTWDFITGDVLSGIVDPELLSAALTITPNPASSGSVNVGFQLDQGGDGVVVVSDLSGRTVRTMSVYMQAGDNNITLPLSSMSAGIYLVEVQTAQNRSVEQLVITR